ncbi:hypothetical protein OHA72_32495 [Dactylosporangium sp. NBC_01737]|uniref:hypothetical protein n=1 Tax=Dactylosporangium sp. NBC_01737 TaxID=2975959 RepID=UPI002E1327DA|nr:hypothetical protein OHA72_32495 [Dactylosporangium sp. NBC_01737]
MRTRSVVLVIALACAALVAGTVIAVDQFTAEADNTEQECTAALQADQAKVRTTRDWTSKDIPGIGDYVEIHWQGEKLGSPCSRVPGPTDWQAEGVLRLRDTDTGAFAAWAVATVPPTVRDTLRPFVPEGVRWRHSADFPQAVQGGRVDLFVDPERAVAWFSFETG